MLLAGIGVAIIAGWAIRKFEVPDSGTAIILANEIKADYLKFTKTLEQAYRDNAKPAGEDMFLKELGEERKLVEALKMNDVPSYDFGDSFIPRVLSYLQSGCPSEPRCLAMSSLEALGKSAAISDLKKRKAKLADLLATSPDKLELSATISTNLGRLLALAFVSAMAGLLVTQYRYNLRLAAYYDARADALAMLELDEEADFHDMNKIRILEKLASLLTPTAYNFGKSPPVASVEQVVAAAKEMSSKMKQS